MESTRMFDDAKGRREIMGESCSVASVDCGGQFDLIRRGDWSDSSAAALLTI